MLEGRAHTAAGLDLSLVDYLARAATLESLCGVPRPDVIYDLGRLRSPVPGYTLVSQQSGWVRGGTPQLPGAPVQADQLLLVRDAFANRLRAPEASTPPAARSAPSAIWQARGVRRSPWRTGPGST